MARQKKHPKMPKWIWRLPEKTLNHKEKHFCAYLWWHGAHGCHSWNYRLAALHKCSQRTIKRRIAKLKILQLIHIGHPLDRGRTIWANPYYKKSVWEEKTRPKIFTHRGPKVAYINNAQHDYYDKAYSNHAGGVEGRLPPRSPGSNLPSNAGGLGGSGTAQAPPLQSSPEARYDQQNREKEIAMLQRRYAAAMGKFKKSKKVQ